MLLHLTATSERGKPVNKTANEFLCVDFTVNRESIGEIELEYFNDTIKDEQMNLDEWILKYRATPEDDWKIIAQGNI